MMLNVCGFIDSSFFPVPCWHQSMLNFCFNLIIDGERHRHCHEDISEELPSTCRHIRFWKKWSCNYFAWNITIFHQNATSYQLKSKFTVCTSMHYNLKACTCQIVFSLKQTCTGYPKRNVSKNRSPLCALTPKGNLQKTFFTLGGGGGVKIGLRYTFF